MHLNILQRKTQKLMLSNSLRKFVKSLQQKKYREETGCFIVEGAKNTVELLQSKTFAVRHVLCTEAFALQHHSLISRVPFVICSERDLEQMGTFQSNDAAIAVGEMQHYDLQNFTPQGLVLVLDGVRDPGNMGTIIRLADWFGCSAMVCAHDCVDFYNPKVLNASMGSFLRVKVYYTTLANYLKNATLPVIGATLQGTSMYAYSFPREGMLLLGSEAHGISPELMPLINQQVTIPNFGGAESLNVGMATAVLLSWWRGHI